jgi:hypothetical protein
MNGQRLIGFLGHRGFFSGFMLWLGLGASVEARAEPASVLVQVANRAAVPASTLALARLDVIRIYREIQVDIVFTDETALSNELIVNVLATADQMHASPSVMGLAVRATPTAGGRFAYVFYDRIQAACQRGRRQIETARVLAAVMAHELGHLLLPYGSHSQTGLMRGGWNDHDLQDANFGWLRFSKSEGDLIRRRLAGFNLQPVPPV